MQLWQDARTAIRQIARAPVFTAVAVLSLSLGTGANTGIFSLLNGILRPLPVPDADRIVVVAATFDSDETGFRYRVSLPTLLDYRGATAVFSDVFGFHNQLAGLTHGGTTTQFVYHVVTGNFFSGLRVGPALGRVFQPGEGEHPASEPVLVLGYATWQKRFGGSPAVIGASVRMNGKPVRIVGVAQKGFHGIQHGIEADGYVPIGSFIRSSYDERLFTDRSVRPLTMLGRLQPGIGVDTAQAAVEVVARRLAAAYPAERGVSARVLPEPMARPAPGRELSELLPVIYSSLFALAGLVLLIACLNVSNLMFVRATARQREMAVRAALGAGRRRLIQPLLIESCVIAVLGVIVGLLLARWSTDVLLASIDPSIDLPLHLAFDYDWRVFLYASGVGAGTGLLVGLAPAIRVTKTQVTRLLQDGGHGGTSGAGRQRVRSALVVAQVAGSLVLLVVAGLAGRNLQTIRWTDPQFDHQHLLTVRIDPAQVGYSRERAVVFFDELDRRLAAMPGVDGVTASFTVPLGYMQGGCSVRSAETLDGSVEKPEHMFGCNAVDADFFDVLGIPLLQGRSFSIHDTPQSEPVVVVNQTMARRLWPGQDAVGKYVVFPASPLELQRRKVVGVARDSKYINVYEEPLPYVYTSMAQEPSFMRSVYVRSRVQSNDLVTRLLGEVRAVDAEMPVADINTMAQTMAGGLGYMIVRISAVQAGAMGGLGLLLSVIGVFGVVSYAVSQRTREIGIRMAIGAAPAAIWRMVFAQGARLVAAGTVVGLMLAVVVTTWMSRLFFLVHSTDIPTFVSVTAILLIVVLTACAIPAARATRVNPIGVLRQD